MAQISDALTQLNSEWDRVNRMYSQRKGWASDDSAFSHNSLSRWAVFLHLPIMAHNHKVNLKKTFVFNLLDMIVVIAWNQWWIWLERLWYCVSSYEGGHYYTSFEWSYSFSWIWLAFQHIFPHFLLIRGRFANVISPIRNMLTEESGEGCVHAFRIGGSKCNNLKKTHNSQHLIWILLEGGRICPLNIYWGYGSESRNICWWLVHREMCQNPGYYKCMRMWEKPIPVSHYWNLH